MYVLNGRLSAEALEKLHVKAIAMCMWLGGFALEKQNMMGCVVVLDAGPLR